VGRKIVADLFDLIGPNIDIRLNRAIETSRSIDPPEEVGRFRKKRFRLIVVIDDCV